MLTQTGLDFVAIGQMDATNRGIAMNLVIQIAQFALIMFKATHAIRILRKCRERRGHALCDATRCPLGQRARVLRPGFAPSLAERLAANPTPVAAERAARASSCRRCQPRPTRRSHRTARRAAPGG